MEGGSKEKMQELELAYRILSDPEKRKKYDETGDTSSIDDESILNSKMIEIFLETVSTIPELHTVDIIAKCIGKTFEKITHTRKEITNLKKELVTLRDTISRLSVKGGKTNVIGMFIENQVEKVTAIIEEMKAEEDLLQKIHARFKDYNYRTDVRVSNPSTSTYGFTIESIDMDEFIKTIRNFNG